MEMSQMSWAIDPSGTMPLVPEPSRELGIVPRTLLSSTNSGLTSRFPPRRLPHASFWVQECEKKREEGWDAGKMRARHLFFYPKGSKPG